MTISTLLPDSTSANTGALTGGASVNAVLADSSDATYVEYEPDEGSTFGFSNLALPSGAIVRSCQFWLRTRKVNTGAPPFSSRLLSGATEYVDTNSTITWTSPTTHSNPTSQIPTDADADAFTCVVQNNASSASVRLYTTFVVVFYVEVPTLTVLSPTGTITEDSAPDVMWVPDLDSDGGAQTHYEVKVFSAAQYGAGGFDPDTSTSVYESGEVVSVDTLHTIATPLADGTYRSYVRIAQTVNGEQHWSDWDSEDFVIDVLTPALTSVTVTPQAGDARHMIEVETDPGGDTTADYVEFQASYDGGVTWQQIRTELGAGLVAVESDAATAYDWEAPNGVEATYRVRAVHDFDPGYSYSAWLDEAATWSSDSVWLKHPVDPSMNLETVVVAFPSHSRAARQGNFQTLGGTYPVVVTDTRSSRTGQLVVRVDSEPEREGLDALLDAGLPVLLQFPAGAQEPDRWLSLGDQERRRLIDQTFSEVTEDTISWVEVARVSDEYLTNSGVSFALLSNPDVI